MRNIIFFDTETTGNTAQDLLIQLAYKSKDETFEALYGVDKKIPPEASAVHHITNKMLDGKPKFQESPDYEKVKNLFEDENSVVVAHNATFDLVMIEKEGIKPKNFICTLRLARYLDPEEKVDRYNLQYLRYLLEIEVEASAHDALGDVIVLEKLYERFKNKLMEKEGLGEEEAIEKMIEVSSHPTLFSTIRFGKHNGKKLEEIAKTDRGYLEWLYSQKTAEDQIDEDWVYTLKYYLEK